MKLSRQNKQDINTISRFLAFKNTDISNLKFQFDILIIMPSAVLDIADTMVNAYNNKVARNYIIAGGIGHSTDLIKKAVRNEEMYKKVKTENMSEAEIYYQILDIHILLENEPIYLDIKSTNCGSNASNSLKIVLEKDLPHENVLIIQDPTMQRRTIASFQKKWNNCNTKFYSYVPFVPLLEINHAEICYTNHSVYNLWEEERFISLIMGELLRLHDTKEGYGPRGKDYIVHVDVPREVLQAYERLYITFKNENLMRT